MNIGFQGRFLSHPYTGIGQYTRWLLEEFSKQEQHRFFVPTIECEHLRFNSGRAHAEFGNSVSIQSLLEGHLNGVKRHFFEQHLSLKYFRKHLVDLIHFPYPAHPWRTLSVPTIVTIHDVIPWIFPQYRGGILSSLAHSFTRRALHYATRIVTVSEFSKSEIVRVCGIAPEKIHVIYNGCSPIYESPVDAFPAARMLPNILRERPFILYVGGYDERKNVHQLVEVFRAFVKTRHGAVLVLVGKPHFDSPLYRKTGLSDLTFERIDDTFEMASIESSGLILRTEFLQEEFLAVLYRCAKFFIHLSSYEGFNIPLLEAMKSGSAIVLSDIPVHREIADDAAIFVDSSDAFHILKVLQQLWNDANMRESYADRARQRSKSFSWKRSAKQHLDLYASVCHSPPSSSSLSF